MHEGREVATVALGRLTPRIARVRLADRLVSIDDGVELATSYRDPVLRRLRDGRVQIRSPRDGTRTVTVLSVDEPGHTLRAGLRMSPLSTGSYESPGIVAVICAALSPRARRIKKQRNVAAGRLCAIAGEYHILAS